MRVTTLDRRRLETALALSLVVHVVAAVCLGRLRFAATPVVHPALALIPVSLVGTVGGGGGERGPVPGVGPPAPPVAAPAPLATATPAPPPPVAHVHRPTHAATLRPVATPQAPAVATAPGDVGEPVTGAGSGGGTGGGGGGDGTGGDGSGGARIAYGSNPKPPYPVSALRLRIEGTVLLEVTVAPDGRAGAVRVQQSSGNSALDDSALVTVRDRWRFVPARTRGVPVEGTVQVPIRFRLVDDRG